MSELAALQARAEALLASDRVTAPTRRALRARLDWRRGEAGVLTANQFATLEAAVARLVPLGPLTAAVDLAGRYADQLAAGPGDGWRPAELPADAEAARFALDRLEGLAGLPPEAQDARLAAVQAGEVDGWPFPAARWFEDLLAALTQLAYAHPLVQLDIGYDGMADAHGFSRVDFTSR